MWCRSSRMEYTHERVMNIDEIKKKKKKKGKKLKNKHEGKKGRSGYI